NEMLTLNAFLDYSPVGGLRNINTNSSWGTGATTINLANSFTAIDVDGGTSLVLNGTVTGSGLTKLNTGTLVLTGTAANSYTGQTVVTGGTLQLNKTAGVAGAKATIVINPGPTVQPFQNDGQTNSTPVRILGNGTFDLNGRNTQVSDLTLAGGTVQTGGGVLTLNGNVHVNGAGNPSIISGVVSLSNGGHLFNVA